MSKTIDKLMKYVELSNDEHSEFCVQLRDLWVSSNFLSAELRKSLENEIISALEYYEQTFKIITKKEIVEREWHELEEQIDD